MATSSFSIGKTSLRQIQRGMAIGDVIQARDLWKKEGGVVFVVRRPGWSLCREEALDITEKYNEILARTPSLRKVPLFGVIKEAADTEEIDTKLGITEFQSAYFDNRNLYLDSELQFYSLLGKRRLSIPFSKLFLHPWSSFTDFKSLLGRLKDRKIEGNLAGEGLIKGGVIIFGPGDKDEVIYKYEEVTGSKFLVEDFEKGLLKLETTCETK